MVDRWLRPHLLDLKPYSCARDEFEGEAKVWLDANENTMAEPPLNQYPDPRCVEIRKALADIKGTTLENIVIGNGSDELIDLCLKLFVEPAVGTVVVLSPSYGMYEVSANIHGAKIVRVPLDKNFGLTPEAIEAIVSANPNLVFLCSPNNPTGNCLESSAIQDLLERLDCPVVVDEAYIDFTDSSSCINELGRFPNLIVLQTLSKAWGLAGARIGIAYASPEIIGWLMKVKPPYNVSTAAQSAALRALGSRLELQALIEVIREERQRLVESLVKSPFVTKVYPSDANFLLVRFKSSAHAMEKLLKAGIVSRDRSNQPGCDGCLRITIGSPIENDLVLASLEAPIGRGQASQPRTSSRKRKTNETSIWITLNLDGHGKANVKTGIGFFDHMLEQLIAHSGVDAVIRVQGDTWIDEHHTIEDTGIALGEAFDQALGNAKGITRYGFTLPMDESRAEVLLDLCGRRNFVWNATFQREKIGDFPTEMFPHFFRSFSDGMRATLQMTVDGQNEHHMIESLFKAMGRTLRQAIKIDPSVLGVPSTKGIL